jgi:D-alanine-D-alanine ligase-like ATP-grasp enzyme
VQACKEKIKSIAMIAAQTLDKRFTDMRELGIDIAIDVNGHIWFIEANSKPAHHLFTQLSNKSMLRKIKENKRKMYVHGQSIQAKVDAFRKSESP